VRDLGSAFNRMTRELQMRMEELRYTTRVQERIEGELSAARSIQMSMLVKHFPAFPDRGEIDLHGIVKPARAVGGDFYDFYFLDHDHLCLLVGDVAGKGVPAALYMAVSKTLLKANAGLKDSPGEMLARVNNELHDDGRTGMFISLAYAILNVRTGSLELCSAGHPAPYLISADGGVSALNGASGVALGAWSDLRYETSRRKLSPGDTLVFFTDGVTEAVNSEKEFYASERLLRLLRTLSGRTVEQITRDILNDVHAFSANHEQADDLTLLAVRWNGPVSPSPNHSCLPKSAIAPS
jgi:sigma-B regulation protein RsbU (phosphoserine phosphatase)